RAAERPDAIFAEIKDEDGAWRSITLEDFYAQVRAVAKGLIARGVAPGDRVGIMGDTRYEWAVSDFAALAAGAITVPIYPSSSAKQVAWILADAGISLVATDTPERAEVVTEASGRALVMSELDALAAEGEQVTDRELDERTANVQPDDLAT